jgi:hypothetical protein
MQFTFHLFILLFGFVLGNLFPTFFGDFLGKVGTPLFLFLALDFFNYFYYSSPFHGLHQRRWKIGKIQTSNNPQPPPISLVTKGLRLGAENSFLYSFSARANSFKIGFLFGLFVDAFKVGS